MRLVSRAARAVVALSFPVAFAACAGPGGASVSSATPVATVAAGAVSPASSGIAAGGTQPTASDAATGSSGVPVREVWLPEWAAEGDVPEEVANRRPLPFCGIEKPPAPQPAEFIDRAVRSCFWSAAQTGAEAEFVSIQGTIEGATIATIYRLAADGTVQTLTDFTQDPFGGGAWLLTSCERVVEGEGESLIGVDGCGEAVTLE